MSAEAVGRVVADLKAGRCRNPVEGGRVGLRSGQEGTVVDATALYHSIVERDEPVALYEDHPCIAPPWPSFMVCYENEHGNVVIMHGLVSDRATGNDWTWDWRPECEVDEDRLRWRIDVIVYVGGRGKSGPAPTTGPLHSWKFLVYDDGEPADLHWEQIVPEYPMENWDMAHLVVLGALNFMNCRNVDIVDPERPRPERRRVERTGVTVHTINVFPTGKATRSPKGEPLGGSTPLSSVRGHFAEYGVNGKGLLFGKYAGRFWIAQHARGDTAAGDATGNDYRLVPETP